LQRMVVRCSSSLSTKLFGSSSAVCSNSTTAQPGLHTVRERLYNTLPGAYHQVCASTVLCGVTNKDPDALTGIRKRLLLPNTV
jgi:hypothetical protein